MVSAKLNRLTSMYCFKAWDGLLPAVFFELCNKDDLKDAAAHRVGRVSICIDTCPWQIFDAGTVVCDSSSSIGDIRNTLNMFLGKKIVSVTYSINTQSLFFENNLEIKMSLQSQSDGWYVLIDGIQIIFSYNIEPRIEK